MSGDGRAAILGAVRRNLKRGPLSESVQGELAAAIENPVRHLVPQRSQREAAAQVDLFISMAEAASASVETVATMDAVPAAVAEHILRNNLPSEVVMAPDPNLATLPWSDQSRLKIEQRVARNGDRTSVTAAFAGVAETGTLLLLSAPEAPTTLNFLPDLHIVVLKRSAIVGPYEDAWDRLRARQSPHAAGTGNNEAQGAATMAAGKVRREMQMPRTINMITGPSRSADIEQTLQLGAHGPIELHIVLVED